MPTIRRDGVELFYQVSGNGPEVVLLHPFPLNHHFWDAIVPQLTTRYRVLTSDLRAHGASDAGYGPVTMQKLADDLEHLLREERIVKAFFVGVSIGGYALFEFWRRNRERVAALVLANTRAGAETAEGRANRLRIADEVVRDGTAGFIEDLLTKLLGATTRTNRPDIVDAARRMMQQMSPQDIAGVQRGMADRPDSIPTLTTINVPALVIAGEEDSVPISEGELMRDRISGSRLVMIDRVGHYAAMEKPGEFGSLLREFLDKMR